MDVARMAIWQKVLYALGTLLLLGGGGWAIYERFAVGICPSTMSGAISPYGLLTMGLAANVFSMPPLKSIGLNSGLTKNKPLAWSIFAIAMIGLGFAMHASIQGGVQLSYLALVAPAAIYLMLMPEPKKVAEADQAENGEEAKQGQSSESGEGSNV